MSDRPDIAALEGVAREVAAEWGVELGEPFALARYSFVAPAGEEAVLKVTPPEDDESDEEAEALELWDGDGAVRLLRRDPARRALLVERARPGDDIAALSEEEATQIAVSTGLRLWRPAASRFAGSAITCRAGSTTPRATRSSRWRESSTPRSM